MKKGRKILLLVLLIACCAAFAAYILLIQQSEDHVAPEISFQTEELLVSVEVTEQELLEGVSAWDDRDGDVTAGIVIEGISNISKDKRATVTYAAFDGSGNVAKAKRTLQYVDYQSPRFSLTAPLVFRSGISFDVNNYLHAEDLLDGDLDDKIKATLVGGEGSITDVGVHEVEFRVTNSMGDTIYATIPVEVYQAGTYNATVELSENLVYLEKGALFTAASYLQALKIPSGEILLQDSPKDVTIQIDTDVDTSVPGTYSVAYTVKSGSYTGYTRLVVIVEE